MKKTIAQGDGSTGGARGYAACNNGNLSLFSVAIVVIIICIVGNTSAFTQEKTKTTSDLSYLRELEGKDLWSKVGGQFLTDKSDFVKLLENTFPQKVVKHLKKGWGPAGYEQPTIVMGPIKRNGNLLHASVCKPHFCASDYIEMYIDINTGIVEGMVTENGKSKWYAPGKKPVDLKNYRGCGEDFACARKLFTTINDTSKADKKDMAALTKKDEPNAAIFDVTSQRAGEVSWDDAAGLERIATYDGRIGDTIKVYRSKMCIGILYHVSIKTGLVNRVIVENNNTYYNQLSERVVSFNKATFTYPDGKSRPCFYNAKSDLVAYYLGDADNRKLLFYSVPVDRKNSDAIGDRPLKLVTD